MQVELTDKVRRDINRNLKDVQELEKEVKKAQRAGIPGCDELCERIEKAISRMQGLKAEYFPTKG